MRIPATLPALGLAALLAAPAAADSFAPVGLWKGETTGDVLLVWGEGFCSTGGSVTIGGPCTWTAEDHAGRLDMTPAWPGMPDSLSIAVRWLDQDTILVNGVERFNRKG